MSEDIKKGLLGIVVDETTISQVMPDINSLTYRGYAVQDLCDKCNFEEVAYLVLNGELPNKKQLKNFVKEERLDRKLSKEILSDIRKMPKKAHPMDVARTAVSLMALEDKETKDNTPKANMRKAIRIFSKTPIALAAFFRARKGASFAAENPDKPFGCRRQDGKAETHAHSPSSLSRLTKLELDPPFTCFSWARAVAVGRCCPFPSREASFSTPFWRAYLCYPRRVSWSG